MAQLLTRARQPERYYSTPLVDQSVAEQAEKVASLRRMHRVVPHLGVVMVEGETGEVDGRSLSYVTRKVRHGEQIGACSTVLQRPRWAVTRVIDYLNRHRGIHGQMTQLPLPAYPQESRELLQQRTDIRMARIEPRMDVDGLRPRDPDRPFDPNTEFAAATPAGIMRLLCAQDRVPLGEGVRVGVIGSRGAMVGRHMRPLLLAEGVTPIEHDRALYPSGVGEEELEAGLRATIAESDIVISCVGRPGLVKPDMLHNGMVVIDAGVTRKGGRVYGDLDPSIEGSQLDVLYTGPTEGVGPLTVCELWGNTIRAAERFTATA